MCRIGGSEIYDVVQVGKKNLIKKKTVVLTVLRGKNEDVYGGLLWQDRLEERTRG